MAEKKILSAELTARILDAFTAYVYGHGQVKYRAIEAAMKTFMALPAEVQIELMREDFPQDKVKKLLSDCLLDRETIRLLSSLSPKTRFVAVREAVKIAKKASPKK